MFRVDVSMFRNSVCLICWDQIVQQCEVFYKSCKSVSVIVSKLALVNTLMPGLFGLPVSL